MPDATEPAKKVVDAKKNVSPELEMGEKSETANIASTIDNVAGKK